jgi:hypothetical protein
MVLIPWLALIFGSGIDSRTDPAGCWVDDSTHVIRYRLDAKGPGIHNSTSRRVDLLMNSVQGYLGGHFCRSIRLPTECMECETFEPARGGFAYARHFEFGPDSARYSSGGARITSGSKPLSRFQVTKRLQKKSFPGKVVTFRHAGPSCDDADLVNVEIRYPDGLVRLDSVLNPSFFEYDLDADSEKEQFVFGSRNCSQEMVLFRIAKRPADLGEGMPEPFRALLREFRTDFEISRVPQNELPTFATPSLVREYQFKRKWIGVDANGVRSFPRFGLDFVWSNQATSWKSTFEEAVRHYSLACPNLSNRTDCEEGDKTPPRLLVRLNSGYLRLNASCDDSASLISSLKRRILSATGKSKIEFLDIGCAGPFHWNKLDPSDSLKEAARRR